MKLRKLLIGGLLLLTSFSLASCDLLSDDTGNTTSKTTDTDTGTKTTEDTTKYIVTFDSKGGSDVSSQEITKGNKVTKPSDPTKDGYTFGGWYSDSYYISEYNFTNKVTRDLTLYAKWNEIPKTVKYEVGTPIVTQWTDSINSKWIKVAVPVTNTGEANLYLDDCSIDIESSTGSLLKTISYINGYPEYIKPGETGYYYEETTVDFTATNVVAVPNVQVEKATNDVIRYDITDVTINSDAYNGVKVMGRVQNNTTAKGTLVKVAANLFDSNGKLICNCFTYLENDLNAGSKVGFTITPFAYDDFAPSDVVSYEIYAYPTQFNW